MSVTYIPTALRRSVFERAAHRCEYCLIHEEDTFFGLHVDHVIAEKHGGVTEADNLALACTFCNLHKGSDIASLTEDGTLTPLFNPRHDDWSEHFVLVGARIEARTLIGEVTTRLLQINTTERLLERETLIAAGLYPRLRDARN